MDLTRDVPRSPRAEMGGMKILPRAIDKARAELEGTIGDYTYWGCPINRLLFNALGVTEEEFLDAVRGTKSDDEIVEWIQEYVRPERSRIETMHRRLEEHAPSTPAERERFQSELDRIDPGNDRVTTWVDLIDLEEGRMPKQSATAT